MFLLFKSTGKTPPRFTKNWIHTTTRCLYTKNPEQATRGRVSPRRLKNLKLPSSFLTHNYTRNCDLKPLNPTYDSLIDPLVGKELEYDIQASLEPKGAIASLNHTDHLELIVPHPGACYYQNYLVHRLASKAKADVFEMDIFDFVHLAQQIFHRYRTMLLSAVSAQDLDLNAILNMKISLDEKEEEKELKDSLKKDSVKVYRKEDETSEEEEEDEFEDEDDNEKVTVRFKDKEYHVNLNDLGKIQKSDQATELLLKKITNRCTTMFKNSFSMTDSKKIIHLKDCAVIHDVFTQPILKSLISAVEDLRQKGHSLAIVASHSQKSSIKDYFAPTFNNMHTTVFLPPSKQWDLWKQTMQKDELERTAEINSKGWIALCNKKNTIKIKVPTHQNPIVHDMKNLQGISDAIWNLKDVEQRAAMAIGCAVENNKKILDFQVFKAVNDSLVCTYPLFKQRLDHFESKSKIYDSGSVDLETLKEMCNKYERKMIPRIVDPNKVQGSFQDIRAQPSTIDTLESLISLPLTRPELFNHGILKKNFIPGVLLFGPSGTGKTMLAKAVAKESGSRMLDIQASDIYDMYVGQGEKNVRAVFSLARKLSPCVVFIDEVDSLMSKRGSDHSSKSHREIINQFMVEWDGLSSNNKGVIVMAATNRPFDLDDAVLRRMPRRILVDLPNEQDRLEILRILLKDQAHQADLQALAKSTNYYSGSDLKNMCVAAALSAAQEHAKSNKAGAVVLETDHFKRALKVVLPSSSEEMESLVEIRKWDSQFGDGMKKKTPIGFS